MKKRDHLLLYLIFIVVLVFMLAKRPPFSGQSSFEKVQPEEFPIAAQPDTYGPPTPGAAASSCNTILSRQVQAPQRAASEGLKLAYSPRREQLQGRGILLSYSTDSLSTAGIYISDQNNFILSDGGLGFYKLSGIDYPYTKVTADAQGEVMAYAALLDPYSWSPPVLLRIIQGGRDGILETGDERATDIPLSGTFNGLRPVTNFDIVKDGSTPLKVAWTSLDTSRNDIYFLQADEKGYLDPRKTQTLKPPTGEGRGIIEVTANCFIISTSYQNGILFKSRIYDLGQDCKITPDDLSQIVASNVAIIGQQVLVTSTPDGKWLAYVTGPLQPGGYAVYRTQIGIFNTPSGRLATDDYWSGIVYTTPPGKYLREIAASDEGPEIVVFFLTTENSAGTGNAYLNGIASGADRMFNTGDEHLLSEVNVGVVGTLSNSAHLKAIWVPNEGGRWAVTWIGNPAPQPFTIPILKSYHFCT